LAEAGAHHESHAEGLGQATRQPGEPWSASMSNVFALGAPGSQLPTTGPPFLEWLGMLGLVHFCGKSPMLAVRRVNSAARPWIDKITEGLLSDWNQANPDERVSDSPDNFEASYIRCPMIPMACLLEDHLR